MPTKDTITEAFKEDGKTLIGTCGAEHPCESFKFIYEKAGICKNKKAISNIGTSSSVSIILSKGFGCPCWSAKEEK